MADQQGTLFTDIHDSCFQRTGIGIITNTFRLNVSVPYTEGLKAILSVSSAERNRIGISADVTSSPFGKKPDTGGVPPKFFNPEVRGVPTILGIGEVMENQPKPIGEKNQNKNAAPCVTRVPYIRYFSY